MPRPPNRVGYDHSQPTVIALGVKTDHWHLLLDSFPPIVSCCLDVRRAFTKQWDESTRGTGFDLSIRSRITSKKAWPFVWEIALSVLLKFGLLIVVCNYGKHRSLSLAYEMALHTHSRLFTPCDQQAHRQFPDPGQFLSRVTDR